MQPQFWKVTSEKVGSLCEVEISNTPPFPDERVMESMVESVTVTTDVVEKEMKGELAIVMPVVDEIVMLMMNSFPLLEREKGEYEPVKLFCISMEKEVSVRVPVEIWKRYVPEKDARIVQ